MQSVLSQMSACLAWAIKSISLLHSIELSTSVKFESFFVAILVNCLGELGVALINQAYLSNKEMQIWRENFHVNESK